MKKIVFATNNFHKLNEIKEILGEEFQILSLKDIQCYEDIEETGKTLEENAKIKALHIYEKYNLPCFADDTGLEVEALNGEPGVRSARYDENTDHDSQANMKKLLKKLQNKENRNAQFRTVIAYIAQQEENEDFNKQQNNKTQNNMNPPITLFQGIVKGHIAKEKKGINGFGYDPIFIPEGYNESFAQMESNIKNKISHRAKAVEKLAQYLKKQKI